ncbi:dihydrodipicolinate synthase family protein [Saccharococcus caldoxylosilyticus]|uniref:dihydrodipicolinate synthase family protein n=1 Tax=Saccharococcus caldoxylosilyticus TaxID=81408 RepID=UPI000312007D|nr:dihydrodipicolinate synthase family protein [Parageobacillus caldoxylosilyticus]BDG36225.1 dihydrodipicolinate synthase family protein [Parageobacillus caldoxylosilyticus]BDG40010.1 dihydrodipicolinate synthase family protein [Parageobacillus caldoxylosilyticus]BDG43730.1 dihydrodipicolinate synthase family protein [Parageobacillus caldoxylosilyticus]
MDYKFKGIIPPVVTLFNKDGEFDWEANYMLADHLIKKGVHGLLYMGSMGEFSSLTVEERKLFVEKMVRYVDGRVPVLIGTGTASLKDTIYLSQHAEYIGANGVLVVNPFYWKYTERQLYDYYVNVAKSIKIPLIIYNIPSLTGQDLSPSLILRLAMDQENIVGVKDTTERLGHIRQLIGIAEQRADFSVFAAFDDLLLPALQMGAAGGINGTATFLPELSVRLFESFKAGQYQTALTLNESILKLMSIYELSQPLFIAVKEAVHQLILGHQTSPRLPIAEYDDLKKAVQLFLKQNNLFSYSNEELNAKGCK